ncbi:nitroreductase family protein [Vibrio cyclitrophicus]|uniref:nitroreductase family protein n=1 Tax=Vibrio cyclitrophicus TaxID=47951 RepID=UPI000C867F08|nr:nitroreductase family protein [Vibrio cyclitrophicus]PME75365.1 hypothetical protein BCV29_18630 [Vibrio cyclitrophicus]
MIKRIFPKSVRKLLKKTFNLCRLVYNVKYDLGRFLEWSATNDTNSKDKILGRIIVHYHVLEKGMNFEQLRVGYGKNIARNLALLLNEYNDKGYDKDEYQYKVACSIMRKYFEINNSIDLTDISNIIHEELLVEDPLLILGGKKVINKEDINVAIDLDFKRFFESRHSIREFSNVEVDMSLLFEAVDLAKKYPSVCNRQAVRVYIVEDKTSVLDHLKFQNGNRGFSDKIDKLVIVTVDLSLFESALERNQPFIDGGIYLMGLLLSIHSVGLGAVALNWSTNKKMDMDYRKFSNIKESETIISFVGVGHLKDKMTVPCSERNGVEDIVTLL